MKILNFGSLNVDHVYRVPSMVKPGQTISSRSVAIFPGGKGLNQSIALARAGAEVYHAGMRGEDGAFLQKLLEDNGVDCRFLRTMEGYTGTAFIQVDDKGQNSIVLDPGTNDKNTREFCDQVLSFFNKGDILLLQNEINEISYLIDQAWEKGMKVVLNPSPMNEKIEKCNLNHVSLFLMNEEESASISHCPDEKQIPEVLLKRFPDAEFIMTLGSRGSLYFSGESRISCPALKVQAVDTTAAGDTYTGYLLAYLARDIPMGECMKAATQASAIAVTRPGAASSIPLKEEVNQSMGERK